MSSHLGPEKRARPPKPDSANQNTEMRWIADSALSFVFLPLFFLLPGIAPQALPKTASHWHAKSRPLPAPLIVNGPIFRARAVFGNSMCSSR